MKFELSPMSRIIQDTHALDDWSTTLHDYRKTSGYRALKSISEDKINKMKKVIEETHPEYRHHQRHVKYYFLKLHRLDVQGFLPKKLLKVLLSVDGIKLFFDVVQPLDNVLNKDFDNSEFEELRKRAKDLKIKEVMEKSVELV